MEEQIVRILHIVGTMNAGGQEAFIMNMYRNIDRQKLQFDFVVNETTRGFYDNEIEKMGGKIYRITPMSNGIKKHMQELEKIIKEGKYTIIHRHTSSAIILPELLVAKKCKVKHIIVHSHNTSTNSTTVHKILKPFMNKIANHKFACGEEAGKWLYGEKKSYQVIQNGINIEKYKYDEKIRNEKRKELEIEDEFVIGNVARFNKQKNHTFIIAIFEELLKIKPKSILLLIGEGEEKEKIEKICIEKNIKEKVRFLGVRDDVNELLQAMDVFLFPSLYEGLPVTLIEAQASGIKIYASNTITEKVNITKNIEFLRLEEVAKKWADRIVNSENARKNNIKKLYEMNYDSKKTAQNLQQQYLKMR